MRIKLEHQNSYLIGVISDTHGRISSGVSKAFHQVDLIIHAGDIGEQAVLDKLSKIAPVVAVRGNMDFGKWTDALPETDVIEIGPIVLCVLHIAKRLDANPAKAGFNAVISGHTHRPDVYKKNGVMFINPGSASYPKYGQPASAALIQIKGDRFGTKLIGLEGCDPQKGAF